MNAHTGLTTMTAAHTGVYKTESWHEMCSFREYNLKSKD